MRWFFGIILAAILGTAAYSLGFGPEVAYVVRAITRHVVGYH